MSLKTIVVIPARMESTRLPCKPLLDINGKSLLYRTYLQCLKVVEMENIYVATDHLDIKAHCENHDIQVVMTSVGNLTGTDRIAEFAQTVDADIYINVQGDEPLINPKDILKIKNKAEKNPHDIINGYARIIDEDMYRSFHIPKVVFRPDGRLLYMSRSPIPGNKLGDFKISWRQICIYAFPKKSLLEFSKINKKTPLELEEDIEILRFLEMGLDVKLIELTGDSIAVDTIDDLNKVIKLTK